jgi:Site-specific recombinase XerD
MKSTIGFIFYVRRDKMKSDGTLPIFCGITINKKRVSFNTKASVNPEIWDADTSRASIKTKEGADINRILDKYIILINNKYNEIFDRNGIVEAEELKNCIIGNSTPGSGVPDSLLQVFKQHNDEMEKLVGLKFSPAILQKYKCVYKKIKLFISAQYNKSDIKLKEIRHKFLTDFEAYMRIEGNKTNTVARNMRLLKKIINIAKNNGWILVDPYANYKIRFEKTDRGYLTEDEIKLIIDKEFTIERIKHVRDVFIFSCFTGLSFSDIHELKYEDIRTNFDNRLWIMKKRIKTGTDITVPLMDIPLSIIERFRDKQKHGKVLPSMCNQKMNSYLKEIADLCGIEKNLTFHMARHTFATLFLTLGVPIESVSKMLGHTKISTTQIYARITDNKISNDMGVVEGKLRKYEYSKVV